MEIIFYVLMSEIEIAFILHGKIQKYENLYVVTIVFAVILVVVAK